MPMPRWFAVASLWFQGFSAGAMMVSANKQFLLWVLLACGAYQGWFVHQLITERKG